MENRDHSTSDAQRQANQQNAQHSTGPRTESGKQRSKLNATRHSLTGQVHITTEEDRIAYDAHCKAYFAEWNPPTVTQTHLVQTLADKQWQIHHGAAILQSIYIQGQAALADKVDADHPEVHDALTAGLFTMERAKEIELISRYTSRLQRDFRSALHELQTLRADYAERQKKEMADAIQIKKFCDMQEEPFNPAKFGFVSQAKDIEIQIFKEDYLEQAKIAAKYNFNREKDREAVKS